MNQDNNQVPNDPVQVQEPVVPTVPPAAPNNKSKMLLIIGGALLALAAIAVAVWFVFFNITKEDYKKAETTMSDIQALYDKSGDKMTAYTTELSSSYSSESEVTAAKDDFNQTFGDYNSRVDGLKNQKAMRDNEVKKRYDEFADKNKKYAEAVEGLAVALPEFKVIRDKCNTNPLSSASAIEPEKFVETYDKGVAPCIAAAKKLSESKVSAIANHGKNLAKGLEVSRTYVQKMQTAMIAKDSAAAQKAVAEMLNDPAIKAMSSREAGNEISQLGDKLDVKDDIASLKDLLAKKAK